ncbi:MAG TPA: dephospho-CoA kinase [Gemmatimonadales bacterium]
MTTLSVGLTGNVASGKSSVGRLFESWGARLIDADRIVHELQRPGSPVLAAMVARFGPGILAGDGTLDRAGMRRLVTADPGARRDLEAIVHPAVRARRDQLTTEARQAGVPVVIQDIPLLFETMDPAGFDAVVLVDAPASTRRDRLIRDRGLSGEEADRLMAMQMPSDAKRSRSQFVIDNDGDRATLAARSRAVWEALLTTASHA